MRCPKCNSRLKSMFYYTTKPKHKKNTTKFYYCEKCDDVFRIEIKGVNYGHKKIGIKEKKRKGT